MKKTLLWVVAVMATLLLLIVTTMMIRMLSLGGSFRDQALVGSLAQLFLLTVIWVGLGLALMEAIRAVRRN